MRTVETIDSELRLLAAVRRCAVSTVASGQVVAPMSCSTSA
jgi:hypothetical protein